MLRHRGDLRHRLGGALERLCVCSTCWLSSAAAFITVSDCAFTSAMPPHFGRDVAHLLQHLAVSPVRRFNASATGPVTSAVTGTFTVKSLRASCAPLQQRQHRVVERIVLALQVRHAHVHHLVERGAELATSSVRFSRARASSSPDSRRRTPAAARRRAA